MAKQPLTATKAEEIKKGIEAIGRGLLQVAIKHAGNDIQVHATAKTITVDRLFLNELGAVIGDRPLNLGRSGANFRAIVM